MLIVAQGTINSDRAVYAARHRKALRRKEADILRGAPERSDEWFEYMNVRPVCSQFRWAPDRRLMMPLVSIVGPGSRYYTPSADNPYRESLYGGAPSKYVDPTRALASSGDGSIGNPWNLNQAMASAVAGDIVGWTEGPSVDIATTDNDNIPAFNPAASGTSGSRIVHVTKYAAVALANPGSNVNATRLNHDGSIPTMSPVGGTGCAAFGSNGRSYITYDGQVVIVEDAWPKADSGVMRVENATGVVIRNVEIINTYGLLPIDNNPDVYRTQTDTNSIWTNSRVTGWRTTQTGGSLNQPGYVITLYDSYNYTISHIEMIDCDSGYFQKGGVSRLNYGVFEYSIMDNVDRGMRIANTEAGQTTTIRYNLFKNYLMWGLALTNETSSETNHHVDMYNNTVAADVGADGNYHGAFYWKNRGNTGTVRDNLLTGTRILMDAGELTVAFPTCNYNGYYRSGGFTGSYNGTGYNNQANLTSWRTGTSQEANSTLLASDPFNNAAEGDFTLAAGSPALTASSTGGPVGYTAGSEQIGVVA